MPHTFLLSRIDPGALVLCRELEAAGFAAYLVGGCVRDLMMDREPSDWDIASSATPELATSTFQALGYTVLPIGLRFGTVGVLHEQRLYELTTLRSEGTYTDHRRPDSVDFTQSIEADLSRRDFTVNAMALRLREDDCELIDCHRGLEDLCARVIRAVGDPVERFGEDALRIMRAARFAAVLGFTVEEGTLDAMRRCGGGLAHIAMERVNAELRRILLSAHPEAVALLEGDALAAILPETSAAWRNDPTKRRMLCALTRAAPPEALAHAATEETLFCARLAILLSCKKNLELVQERTKMLRLTKKQRYMLLYIFQYPYAPNGKRAAHKRLLARDGIIKIICRLTYHRAFALADEYTEKLDRLDVSAILIDEILQNKEPYRIDGLAVNGYDMLSIGFRGPAIAEALEACLALVIEDPERNTREWLLAYVQDKRSPTR